VIPDRSPSNNVATALMWIFRAVVFGLVLAGTLQTLFGH